MTMIRIFYISKAAPGVNQLDHEQILGTARRNNRSLGITGLLVVKGDYFAQALEGEKQEVESLYQKIAKDPRHTGLVCLSNQEVEERIFPQWSMGYRNASTSPLLQEVELNDPRFVSDPQELSLIFRSFIQETIQNST